MDNQEKLDDMFTMEEGLPVVNKEFTNIESVYRVMKRDQGMSVKGKRIKIQARKELAFCYFWHSRHFANYGDDEKVEVLKRKIGLNEDWKPDDLIYKVIQDLAEDIETVTSRFLTTTKALVFDNLELFAELRLQTRLKINILRISEEDATREQMAEKEILLANLSDNLITLGKSVQNFHDMLEHIKKLELAQRTSVRAKKGNQEISELEENHDRYRRRI